MTVKLGVYLNLFILVFCGWFLKYDSESGNTVGVVLDILLIICASYEILKEASDERKGE